MRIVVVEDEIKAADNAVKYHVKEGVSEIILSLNPTAAEMVFASSGSGISAEVGDRVFELFFRDSVHYRLAIKGSGLGLNIAQWIVHSHGGDIAIRRSGWNDLGNRAAVEINFQNDTAPDFPTFYWLGDAEWMCPLLQPPHYSGTDRDGL